MPWDGGGAGRAGAGAPPCVRDMTDTHRRRRGRQPKAKSPGSATRSLKEISAALEAGGAAPAGGCGKAV